MSIDFFPLSENCGPTCELLLAWHVKSYFNFLFVEPLAPVRSRVPCPQDHKFWFQEDRANLSASVRLLNESVTGLLISVR